MLFALLFLVCCSVFVFCCVVVNFVALLFLFWCVSRVKGKYIKLGGKRAQKSLLFRFLSRRVPKGVRILTSRFLHLYILSGYRDLGTGKKVYFEIEDDIRQFVCYAHAECALKKFVRTE